jgi:hypothetical protein
MRSGRRFHQCYCGNAGFIEGMIETIDANQRTIPIEPAPSKFMTEGRATTTNVAAVNPTASSAVQGAARESSRKTRDERQGHNHYRAPAGAKMRVTSGSWVILRAQVLKVRKVDGPFAGRAKAAAPRGGQSAD